MQDLHALKIDKALKTGSGSSRWAVRWILGGVVIFLLLGAGRWVLEFMNREIEVAVARTVNAAGMPGAAGAGPNVVLNATGYIVAHHKIQLASKVVGKVAWIGVEKGDKVRQGQVIVRLEDDEYKAQLQQARGQLANMEARLLELRNGSRPEEVQAARANLEAAQADLTKARIDLDRADRLASEGVYARQALDEARARHDSQLARVRSLERTYELVRIGPRQELIEQVRGQIEQARGAVAFYETQLANTVIRAPINGTILERVVERGEFVTTGFVGDRGAKGYVVSLADLNDLQVELDINQNDFARLGPRQRGIITTDAFRDRKYEGFIEEVSPEANRQKATVQVKVKVLNPDSYLRPEMNASVDFMEDAHAAPAASPAPSKPVVFVPADAIRNGAVFVVVGGKAIERPVKTSGSGPQGARVIDGLIGGEDVVVNPPAELKDGARVRIKT